MIEKNNVDLDIKDMTNELSFSNIIKCLEYQQQIFEMDCLEQEELYVEVGK